MAAETQKTDEMKTGSPDIELISGNNNILLIAPHGVETKPYDDENTATLTRLIADQLKCSAVINTAYRKPATVNAANKDTKRINLNHRDQVETHLEKEFLSPLLEYKNEIVKQYGSALVFWIHGAEDDNVKTDVIKNSATAPENVKVLVGYGQKAGKDRPTAQQQTVDKLIKGLDANGLKAVSANPDKKVDTAAGNNSYCGWDQNNMNQWFRTQGSTLEQVQSIQLEFRWTGCRDKKGLEPTAKIFADAISSLIQPETEATPHEENLTDEVPEQKTNLTPKMAKSDQREDAIDVNEQKPMVPVTEEEATKQPPDIEAADEDLKVEEAYQHLKGLFVKHFQTAMLNAGKYIIKQLYDGDYKRAEEKEPTGTQSLSKLIKKLQGDQGNAPSRTWVYDAVNLAIDHHLYEQKRLPSVYGQLGHSHQVNLTYSPNLVIKQALTAETVENEYTVSRLRERIREEKRKEDTDYVSLKEKIPSDRLKTFNIKRLKEIKRQTKALEKKIQERLSLYQENLKKVEAILGQKQKATSKPK